MTNLVLQKGKDTPVSALNTLLLRNQKQIELALPKHLRPERLIRLAVTALNTTPSLQDCSLLSICNSVMLAAQLGLEINNGLGHGWLIPYGKVCTFQPGYRGLLDLAFRTGKITDARAIVVYENEPFTYTEGAQPEFSHQPLAPEKRGEWIGAYSRLTHAGGFQSVYFMWRQEIEEIRDKTSKTKDRGPWVTWFWEMVKKTVIKRHLKMAQLSNEVEFAVGIDDQAEAHAAKEDTPKPRREPVQDLVLGGGIIDDARAADDTLAGSREAQQEVAQAKLKRGRPRKEGPGEAEEIGIKILQRLLDSGRDEDGMNALLRTASYTDGGLKWIEMENLKEIKDVAYLKSILKNLEPIEAF